jgi:hypothetical protein
MDNTDDDHPLTCGQRWLLHVAEHAPDLAKPVQRTYKLEPPVDPAALLAAYRQVVGREPSLRMRLVEAPGGVAQRFPPSSVTISGLSIQGATRAHREAYARRMLVEHGRAALDLREQPPVSAKLFEIDGEHVLSLCVDHLAADDLGFDRFEGLLARAYAGEVAGADVPPEASGPHPYLAYLLREAAQRDAEPDHLAFWREHLAGAPLSRRRGERSWVPGRSHRWAIGGETFRRFLRACRARMCSPTAATVAALAAALARIGETDDIVINVPVSNRAGAADQGIVGNLSMLLHVRVRLDPGGTRPELLRRVQGLLLEAMMHRQYDYAILSDHVAEQAAARGGEVHWNVGCSYVLQRDGGLDPSLERMDAEGQPFDLPGGSFTLGCRQRSAALDLSAEWDPEAWPAGGAAFARLHLDELAAALAMPDLFAEIDGGGPP